MGENQNSLASMYRWGQPQSSLPMTPVSAQPPIALPLIGADYEQMPGQGMFAGSAVNAPIAGGMRYQPTNGVTQPGPITQFLRDNGVIGYTDPNNMRVDGWGGLALGAATGLGSLYLGMQQYNLAKETLANNKAQFERQYQANKQLTNSNLEDRQRARVASNAGAYQSVGDYMAQNGIK
jgi:hypothetical protein